MIKKAIPVFYSGNKSGKYNSRIPTLSANIVEQLDPIFKPRSVAVIGASGDFSKWGGRVVAIILASKFQGSVFPINPKRDEIFGLKAYPSVLDVPQEIDLAVFTVPAVHMPKVMDECVQKGVRGGVIISADFAETGERGKALEEETARIARQGGIRFVGPNGMGIWTSAVSLNLCLPPNLVPGPLAFISQSGTYGGSLAQVASAKGYGLSKFISAGNQGDLKAADYLEYLGQDDDTRVIVFYMEGFKDGRRFLEVARKVTKIKPVLIFKGGSSEEGARATLSHTASIAGANEVFEAMCRQAGIIRVEEIEHLFIVAEALIGQPLPAGNRIAVVGSGGQGVVTVDACSARGLKIPKLDEESRQKLKEILPPHAPVPNNPVDFAGGARTAEQEARVAEILASLDYIDGIITNVPVQWMGGNDWENNKKIGLKGAEIFCEIPRKYGKPIVTQRFRDNEENFIEEHLKAAGIPIYNTPEDCARAMSALVKYAEIRKRNNH